MLTSRNAADPSTALSKLQPAQVRELREGFQILDRDSDGQVGREDVADMLTQLGKLALCHNFGLYSADYMCRYACKTLRTLPLSFHLQHHKQFLYQRS